ncbi:MAG: hypothetical protein M9890_04635 [Thermomicrobiales bacterium]|nr:hypothetical protein [Thermomicrobiales bacterium]
MFDQTFFGAILPREATRFATEHPDSVPVVSVLLTDTTQLDVCRVLGLSDQWVALARFRQPSICDDVDIVFVPYPTIARVTIAVPHISERQIGFAATAALGEHVSA